MPAIYKCQECHEEITYLDYSCDAREYGSYNISAESHDCNDNESDGNYSYRCPECDADASSPEDIWYDATDDDEDEDEDEENTVMDTGNQNVKMGTAILNETNVQIFAGCGCLGDRNEEHCLIHQT